VEDGVVLGEGVEVGADCILSHGMKVFPHTTLPDGAIRF
jgi:acetyltransferase-like isoleucine patch superfamily enzyme